MELFRGATPQDRPKGWMPGVRETEESKEVFVKDDGGPLLIPAQVAHQSAHTHTAVLGV